MLLYFCRVSGLKQLLLVALQVVRLIVQWTKASRVCIPRFLLQVQVAEENCDSLDACSSSRYNLQFSEKVPSRREHLPCFTVIPGACALLRLLRKYWYWLQVSATIAATPGWLVEVSSLEVWKYRLLLGYAFSCNPLLATTFPIQLFAISSFESDSGI